MSTSLNNSQGSGPYQANLPRRHRLGRVWLVLFQLSMIVGIIALSTLMVTVINDAFGYVALENEVQPETLAVGGVPLEELPQEELVRVFQENVSRGLYRRFDREQSFSDRSRENVLTLISQHVIDPQVITTWPLYDSLVRGDEIRRQLAEEHPQAYLEFRAWMNPEFITSPQSNDPLDAGVRTAILGSLWTIAITILVAFPLGVAASIYLEEYATGDTWFDRLIQTNINNLASVPSIIYGMLGLAIFVRAMVMLTSGAVFGLADPNNANGRTVLSAGLTLALLVLPLIIINGQESIRAVSGSLRQASYGLGATKWQTIWSHVLPSAFPGIMTGTILAISRAIGETAPLVVIGAATYITVDPSGPFSRFTVLPIQIYQWTTRPQVEFHNLASAAILVLLILLLSLNASAILLRNRFTRRS